MRARGGGERREGREKWAAEALGRRLKRWAAGGQEWSWACGRLGRFCFFSKLLFQTFSNFSNFKLFSKFKDFKPFASFQII
jgi:hypothetical protein